MTSTGAADPPPLLADRPEHLAWLRRESFRLLDFGAGGVLPGAGFGWIGNDGRPLSGTPAPLYVQARMAHCYALGSLIGHGAARGLAARATAGIAANWDPASRAWAWNAADGDRRQDGYAHAFVLLAGASLTAAGLPGGEELLQTALDTIERSFWDEERGVLRNESRAADGTWSDYIGANANMHYVESLLAAGAITGRSILWDRAERITHFFLGSARDNSWRLPEHFDSGLVPLLRFNESTPHDPLRPYGSTVGHWFEWSRLALQLALTTDRTDAVRDDLRSGAGQLFDLAVAEGVEDGDRPGLIYTVDWNGRAVVRQRLHWVVCEALQAAATWWQVAGERRHEELYDSWWSLADTWFIDRRDGSWRHELDELNRPDTRIRPGKADLYHALQATLTPFGVLGPAVVDRCTP